MKKSFLVLLLLLAAESALGEIYTWTDGRGTAHYTNSLYEVPERYRARVKILNLGTEPKDGAAPQQPAPAQPPKQEPQGPAMVNRPQEPPPAAAQQKREERRQRPRRSSAGVREE